MYIRYQVIYIYISTKQYAYIYIYICIFVYTYSLDRLGRFGSSRGPRLREPLPAPRPARDSDDETIEALGLNRRLLGDPRKPLGSL